jgi:hypothetical protein
MLKEAILCGAFALGALIAFGGCETRSTASDESLRSLREKLLLANEPAGAMPINDAIIAAKGGEVVVFGQIGAGKHDPWDAGRAAFLIADPSLSLGDVSGPGHASHDHDNCPFCNKEKSSAAPMAIVQCVDEQGTILPIDARTLLGVSAGQIVVVRGIATVDGLGTLVITADGIYLRG